MKEKFSTIIVPQHLKDKLESMKFDLREKSLHSVIALGIEAIELSNGGNKNG